MDRIKVGHIKYINTYPIFYTILKAQEAMPFDLVSDIPTVLNRMMREGALDVSLISSSAYAVPSAPYLVHSDFCLASTGYVNSVLLISTKDINDLKDAKIGLSNASATSSNLIKIILKEFYSFSNTFSYVPYQEDLHQSLTTHDAVLIIGDEALRFRNNGSYKVYDIGQLWKERTGYPVVFAIIAINPWSAETHRDTLELLFEKFNQSHTIFKKRPAEIAAYAKAHSKLPLDFMEYFSSLNYIFTEECKEGLMFYYRMLERCGLAQRVEQLRFYQ
jgi:chorismate dehydratase